MFQTYLKMGMASVVIPGKMGKLASDQWSSDKCLNFSVS